MMPKVRIRESIEALALYRFCFVCCHDLDEAQLVLRVIEVFTRRLFSIVRTHGFPQRSLVFAAPILAVEVDEYGSVGNCQLSLENEDVILRAILCKFVDQ